MIAKEAAHLGGEGRKDRDLPQQHRSQGGGKQEEDAYGEPEGDVDKPRGAPRIHRTQEQCETTGDGGGEEPGAAEARASGEEEAGGGEEKAQGGAHGDSIPPPDTPSVTIKQRWDQGDSVLTC
ncbi:MULTISPECIES: hypothetical protein [unclassified Corynebacterium]|uniref:hypothetical protein n=1 Tax=unclassified Corynebacterium TaxID=2624378 RepID=UPI0029CA5DA2|nr:MULTISPECIES: hypothetical protein [unclassified Corynebacterium]WPF66179.1 hypothetical protein OLX12_00110 [Corynebacterium sp. 22KM0430]WPF68671.1 hypothetical protein OLW90_00110 [Corynebacterium sp. 21KM1197]